MAWVYEFSQGSKDQKDLLGGKGANLAEMTNLGLPVPPGFTISTETCRAYLAQSDDDASGAGGEPEGLAEEVTEHLARLEEAMGKKLGDADNPLLVSVRSGAKFSMPGMMETVLNVGLNDTSVGGLAARSESERFALDSYRRLLQMFGGTVLHVDSELFAEALDAAKDAKGTQSDLDLDADDLRGLVDSFKAIIKEQTGHDFPQDPREQLDLAIRAVFDSWNTDRARLYRRQERIPEDLGTAVNVQAMVFGNFGMDSGSGVAFTRDPASGEQGVYGDYLQNAQGEDVVAGIRNTVSLADMADIDQSSYDDLMQIMTRLERHYRDMCDIEFTVERGKLWMLQTRVGKRTPEAAFRIAVHMVDEGLIQMDEAVLRVTGDQLAQLMFPRFDETSERTLLATGMNASPGAAVGKAVFDSDTAVEWTERGEDVILVRKETNPDDLRGMVAARGILTSRGGKTSHAAVVARGMGVTCVCGAESLDVDTRGKQFTVRGGETVREGDVISIDGTTGEVFAGAVPVSDSVVVRHFEGEKLDDDLALAVSRIMAHADGARRLRVRTNADTPEDAARARRFGAQGIGLCRTEHMFLGERRELVEKLIVAEGEAGQDEALAALLPLQRQDFTEILEAMDGLPVTIRLLDPPLHEFLPDLTDLSVQVALAEERGESDERATTLLTHVRRLHEQNPMLGLRGVRLGIQIPGLFRMQARAIAEAAADRMEVHGTPRAEIMVPLVASVRELQIVRAQLEHEIAEVQESRGVKLDISIGTMIELPRAAFLADRIAKAADFFSFGTNDLTQMAWGFSRDDVEASFFSRYFEHGIFDVSPFESLDQLGVGGMVEMGTKKGRKTRSDLKVGVCGEHGGDPLSVHFFHRVGLDYVSCSPFRVPVARLEAGRAVLEKRASTS
ncbi:pyruvate, phosphate dikinase [Nocardioides sp. Soil774]|uniref:pyruvate, phosphate dikinase n=1 Tax=Nocardioides sp. Soil774 TaxID=1736408 RepID=UPI000AD36102